MTTEEKKEFKDAVIHSVDIKVDFWSRIRILFGKKMNYFVRIKTENIIGNTLCEEQRVSVEPFIRKKPIRMYHEPKSQTTPQRDKQ